VRSREAAYLDGVAAEIGARLDRKPEMLVLAGHPAQAICAAAHHCESPLIVMSSHGRTGFSRFWIGSVTDAVIRSARSPVLMVRARETGQGGPLPIQRILVALDGSATSEQILPYAAMIAAVVGARVELLQVSPPNAVPRVPHPMEDDAAAALGRDAEEGLGKAAAALHLDVTLNACIGESPAKVIVDTAREHRCELVALTTLTTGLKRLALGSVADKVIRSGPSMALLLRPTS